MFQLLLQLRQVRIDCCAVRRNAVVQTATVPLDFVHRGLPAEHRLLMLTVITNTLELVHPIKDGDALLDTWLDTRGLDNLLLHLLLDAQQVAHLLLASNLRIIAMLL